MYHSFLIHSSADGHLGCFHVLSQPNHALMKGLWQGDPEGVSASQTPGIARASAPNCPLGLPCRDVLPQGVGLFHAHHSCLLWGLQEEKCPPMWASLLDDASDLRETAVDVI